MRQQVNLYQPLRSERGKVCTARTVALSAGALIVVLAGVWTYSARQIARLESELATVRQQEQRQVEMANAAERMRGAPGSAVALQAKVKAQNALLAERQRALTLLRNGAAGTTDGFASRLEALARQHIEGLWLNHIVLSGGPGVLSLSGNAIAAELVPDYLRALAAEPALAATRFNDFRIEGSRPGPSSGESQAAGRRTSIIRFHAAAELNAGATEQDPTGDS